VRRSPVASVARLEVAALTARFGADVAPERIVGDLADVVQLVERLIDALHLETRIWGRV
jgi:hypothetical protein